MRYDVLDKGYVQLMSSTPDADLTVVNAARASFNKHSTRITEDDVRLINYLAREGHLSPFRHAIVTFEIRAPLFVARQWFKYRVGSTHTDDTAELLGLGNGDDGGEDLMQGRNEMSRRYVTEGPSFHAPTVWRFAAKNKKQGSAGDAPDELSAEATERMMKTIDLAEENYTWALEKNLAPEQARLYLPAYSLYTSWWWTASLDGVFHFLRQRLGHGAQSEIHEYALAIEKTMRFVAPLSIRAMLDEKMRDLR